MKILRSVIAACAVVFFVCFTSFTAITGQEQPGQESRGFAAAKQLEGRWVREDGGYMLVLQDFKAACVGHKREA